MPALQQLRGIAHVAIHGDEDDGTVKRRVPAEIDDKRQWQERTLCAK